MSGTGPDPIWIEPKPEIVLIPTLSPLKETPQSSDVVLSLLGLNKLSYFVTNKQISPWTGSRLKHMTGPLRPLRPFTVGFWWTKSCKPVTGKVTHLQLFT